jgi:iron complex outermembrane receptor protein
MVIHLRIVLLATSAAALVSASPAFAQQIPAAATAPPAPAENHLEEIVVTAQRRSENLQKVPVSVTAITAMTLAKQGILDTSSLTLAVPGLDFSRELNGGTPFIRGVGNTTGAVGAEPSVATYVDGVYYPAAIGTLFSLNNIARIEVLKGPQGTLFGRNATGGVIQIITKDPSQTPSLAGSLSYSSFNTVDGAAYATTGLTPNLAIDGAINFSHQGDGWGHNLTTGKDAFKSQDFGARSKLLWRPDSRTEVRLTGDYERTRSDVGVSLAFAPGSIGVDGTSKNVGFYNVLGNTPNDSITSQYGVALKIEHDLDWARLVSITSYRNLHNKLYLDSDATPLTIVDGEISARERTLSQELQLQSRASSTIKWIIGGFIYDDHSAYDPLAIYGAAAAPFAYIANNAEQKTRSYAGFGQVTVPVLASTRVTAGLRYTSDRREINAITDLGGLVELPSHNQATFNKLTWRLSVDQDLTRDILAYASYNRGFKSGTFNLGAPTDPAVRPEVLDAFEVGLKSELLDHHLRLNVAGFYYNYNDIQLSKTVQTANIILNAAKAHIKGIDADANLILTNELSFRVAGAYTDGKYLDFKDAPGLYPIVNAMGVPTGGNYSDPVPNAAGNDTIRTPKYTVSLGPDYTRQTAIGPIELNVLYYYNSGFFWSGDNQFKQPHYHMVNATLGWTSLSGNFGLKVWVKNALDQHYYSYGVEQVFGYAYSPAAPRTVGVSLNAKM